MWTTGASSASPSWAASVVLPEPAGPSTHTRRASADRIRSSSSPEDGGETVIGLRPEAELRRALLGRLDLLAHADGSGTAHRVARGERALDGQHVAHLRA